MLLSIVVVCFVVVVVFCFLLFVVVVVFGGRGLGVVAGSNYSVLKRILM